MVSLCDRVVLLQGDDVEKLARLRRSFAQAGARLAPDGFEDTARDRSAAKSLVAETLRAFGRIDLLVNADSAFPSSEIPYWMPILQAAIPHLKAGATILQLCSEGESPRSLIRQFTLPLIRSLSLRGIRVCFVAKSGDGEFILEPLGLLLKKGADPALSCAAY